MERETKLHVKISKASLHRRGKNTVVNLERQIYLASKRLELSKREFEYACDLYYNQCKSKYENNDDCLDKLLDNLILKDRIYKQRSREYRNLKAEYKRIKII